MYRKFPILLPFTKPTLRRVGIYRMFQYLVCHLAQKICHALINNDKCSTYIYNILNNNTTLTTPEIIHRFDENVESCYIFCMYGCTCLSVCSDDDIVVTQRVS